MHTTVQTEAWKRAGLEMEKQSWEDDGGHYATDNNAIAKGGAGQEATREDRAHSRWEGKLEKEDQRWQKH